MRLDLTCDITRSPLAPSFQKRSQHHGSSHLINGRAEGGQVSGRGLPSSSQWAPMTPEEVVMPIGAGRRCRAIPRSLQYMSDWGH